MFKKISHIIFFICLFLTLFSQETILVDAIHGVDYHIIGDQLVDIQFETIFPDYEITRVTPMDIQWTEVYIDQEVVGNDVYQYSVAVSDEVESDGALYVVVYPLDYRFIWGITGDLMDPEGAVVAEMYQGVGHVDLPAEGTWDIEVELAYAGNYNVKIGYGNLLYSTSQHTGSYSLDDYDLLIRIKNDEAYPFMGKYQEFSETDLTALEEAFDNGLACLNCYNIFNPYVDKPFVHFFTEEPISVDYSVDFNGKETLTKPRPNIRGNRWSWNDLNLHSRSDNELIYEGVYHQPLNFIQFDKSNEFLTMENQTDYSLDNILLLRYCENGDYQLSRMDCLLPGEQVWISNIEKHNGKELKVLLKEMLYEDAVEVGLNDSEAYDFFYHYNWIETMLHRAYDNAGSWICLYHFGKDLYDRILPCYCDPALMEINRNMWVLLSNIDPDIEVKTVDLFEPDIIEGESADYRINEYGLIDEYYSLDFGSREDVFFGITLNEWWMTFGDQNMVFYDNDIGNEIGFGLANLTSFQFLNFFCFNYEECGIIHEDVTPQYPVAVAQKIGSDGRLVVLGTAYAFDNEPENTIFLRNTVNALLNSQYFTDVDPSELPDNYDNNLHHFPNPFGVNGVRKGGLTISFTIQQDVEQAELIIYNLKGQKINQLLDSPLSAGEYSVSWNGRDENNHDVAAGIYFYRLKTDDEDDGGTKKVVKMQ